MRVTTYLQLLALAALPLAGNAQQGRPFLSGSVVIDRDAWADAGSVVTGRAGPQVPVEVRIVCEGKTFSSTVADTGRAFSIPLDFGTLLQLNSVRSLARGGISNCLVRALLPGYRSEAHTITANRNLDVGAITLFKSKGFGGSILSTASSTAPNQARKIYEEALGQLRRRDFSHASENLKHAIEIYPQFAEAWIKLAIVQEAADTRAARESYQKAIAADPAYIYSYQQLMRLQTREALWQQVFDTATAALKLSPHEYPEAWYDLAFAAHQLGRHQEAEEAATRGIAEDPEHALPELERLLGTILLAKGDRAGVVQHWGNYLHWSPLAPDIAYIQNQLSSMSPSAFLFAENGRSLADLVATVRAALQSPTKEERLVKSLPAIVMSERVDDRTIEMLESEGAGAATVAELLRLRDESVRRPVPPSPAIPAPAAPTPDEQERIWNAAAANSHGYSETLPNFICNEFVRRYREPAERPYDTLEIRLSYFDRKESYQLLTINGAATQLSYDAAGGATTKGEFGSTLTSTFAGGASIVHQWDHWTILRKRPAHVYSIRTALSSSGYRIEYRPVAGGPLYSAVASQNGFVYIDAETHRVLRISWEAENVPLNFPVESAGTRLDYDFTDIAGQSYLLPMAAEARVNSPGMNHRNEVEFRNYRKFNVDTNITFGSVKK